MSTKPAWASGRALWAKASSFLILFSANMEVNTTPNAARGEATLTIAGQPRKIRLSMNVMRDVTKLTGMGTGQFVELLSTDFDEAATALVACAVKRYVPGQQAFTQDDAGDLIDSLNPAENDALAEAIKETLRVGPLFAALTAKVSAQPEPTPSENGTNTSTSPSVS
jgi:hypothetical protein